MVTTIFAVAARAMRAVTTFGALTGGAVAFSLYLVRGVRGFSVLLFVFLLTWVATLIGREQKGRTGEPKQKGGRDSVQVFANLYAVLVLLAIPQYGRVTDAAPFGLHSHVVLLAGALAAMSELACDTVSSELGQAFSRRARLITTLEIVPVGTDGGVSPRGTLLGIVAAFSVALFSAPELYLIAIIGFAGTAGMLLDSILGATFERRGTLSNNMVNAISTGFAAVLAATATHVAPGVFYL